MDGNPITCTRHVFVHLRTPRRGNSTQPRVTPWVQTAQKTAPSKASLQQGGGKAFEGVGDLAGHRNPQRVPLRPEGVALPWAGDELGFQPVNRYPPITRTHALPITCARHVSLFVFRFSFFVFSIERVGGLPNLVEEQGRIVGVGVKEIEELAVGLGAAVVAEEGAEPVAGEEDVAGALDVAEGVEGGADVTDGVALAGGVVEPAKQGGGSRL